MGLDGNFSLRGPAPSGHTKIANSRCRILAGKFSLEKRRKLLNKSRIFQGKIILPDQEKKAEPA